MMEPQASRFWHAALKSGLIDATGLEACWQAIAPEKRTPDAIDRRLARQTVRAGYLTLWQAQQILKGRSLGFRIDRYLLIDSIGHGGMGRVYLAKDTRLNRRVALKVLSPERMNNPRALARFQREAKVGAQLQHENLVRIYDEGECNGIHYLVMEFIEGKTAGQIIGEKGRLAPAVAARLARQVALGLDHAQQKGLIHRDVNPWNILVTREGIAKLTDLGLAIDLADNEDAVTRDGATVGTFDYISPEQARHSRAVDTRSDIYSLGCTLYHMLAGQVPFPMPSLPEKLYAHQLAKPEALTQLVPEIPEGLAAVVDRMMAKAPNDRYQDPGAVAAALAPFVTSATAAPASAPASPATATAPPQPSDLAPSSASPAPDASSSQLVPAKSPGSDPEFQNILQTIDLGPQLPLSDSSKSAVKAKVRSKPKPQPESDASHHRLRIAMIAGGIAAVGLAAIFTVRGCAVGGGPTSSQASTSTSSANIESASNGEAAPGAGGTAAVEPADIAVTWPDGSTKEFRGENTFDLLRDAIQSAGNQGTVVLRNRKPLLITAKQALVCPGGHLVIRAGRNVQPVLAVELGGTEPLLVAQSDTMLTLIGITFQVMRSGSGSAAPPLIRAAADLELQRCAFTTTGQSRVPTALSAQGARTLVSGCFFEGFRLPIETTAVPAGNIKLSQCMLIQSAGAPAEAGGWAIKVRSIINEAAKGARGRDPLLEIDHCTLSAQGLLVAEGFGPRTPLKVQIHDCAVHAAALVMWSAKSQEVTKGLNWSGERNRYDLSGAAWVVLPPSGPNSINEGLPASPTDLNSWVKLFPQETDAKTEAIQFRAGPSVPPPHEPADFALLGGEDSKPPAIGADPAKVGNHPAPPKP